MTLPATDAQRQARHKLAIGVAGGVCAFFVSVPFLFSGQPVHIIAAQLLSYSAIPSVAVQIGLLLIVVPILSELVFRGIVFRSLWAASSLWPAAVGSSLFFAWVWQIPTAPAAFILGLATALVFWKTHTLLPAILANATFAVLAETFLAIHDMHLF